MKTKISIVIGGSKGIGKSISNELKKRGNKLPINNLNKKKLLFTKLIKIFF